MSVVDSIQALGRKIDALHGNRVIDEQVHRAMIDALDDIAEAYVRDGESL